MDMTLHCWKDLFCQWPEDLPHRGIAITSFDEQIPFAGFLTSEAFLLLSRSMPDSMGARSILIPYENLVAVKITEVVKPKTFERMGFEGNLPKG
ncbi:MAG: hypothetical protein JW818_09565 [Pirellulales bacterium]|nr:hypothetical protein [Pirellulales bacterium]